MQDVKVSETEPEAVKTFHKGQLLSRKLKRRLTERTFAEARALKMQSKEAIHVLFYATELVSNFAYFHKIDKVFIVLI